MTELTGKGIVEEKFELKKRIGLFSGVAITMSAMVGSGIFVTPTEVLYAVHGCVGVSLLIWLGCGLVALSSCLCYCELGSMLRASGRDFLNFKLAYGPAIAFVYIWGFVLALPGGAPTYQVFARYLIAPMFGDCGPPELGVKLVSIVMILFLHWLNYVSVKLSVKFEVIFTAAKFLSLILIAGIGIVNLVNGNPIGKENFKNSFNSAELSKLRITDISQAFYQGIFSYSGYNALTSVSEEVKNVSRNLPRAVLLAFFSVMTMYLLVNVGYLSVLTPQEIMSSKAVAETFGAATLGVMSWLIPVVVCVSTIGTLNGIVLLAARKLFVASRCGLAPQFFGMIHVRFYTPAPTIILSCFMTTIYVIAGDFNLLVNAASFFNLTCQGLSAASVLVLRRKYPHLHRPYKVPIACPIFTAVVALYFLLTPFIQNPNLIYFVIIGFYILALCSYYVFIVRRFHFPGVRNITWFMQKLMGVTETDWNQYADLNL